MRNGTKQLVNRVLSIVDFDRRNGLLYDWDFDSNEKVYRRNGLFIRLGFR